MRLLIVDDEPTMRTALQASFLRDGWQADTAAGLCEAVQKIATGHFRAVITDMCMEDGTGLDLVKKVRAQQPGTAFILVTAYASVPEAVQAMRHGASDYLVKPVSFERLRNAVRRAVDAGGEPEGRACDADAENPGDLRGMLRRAVALGRQAGNTSEAIAASAGRPKAPLGISLRDAERELLEATLCATEGNRTRAAQMLGISVRTIRNKIRAYGLPPRRYA